jgi:hypothetical protein
MPLLLDVSPPSFALMPFRHCHYFLLMLLRAFIFIFSFFIDAAFFFSLPAMTRRTSAPPFACFSLLICQRAACRATLMRHARQHAFSFRPPR